MKTAAVTKIGSLKETDISKRGTVEIIDIEEQKPGDDDIKIRVAYCAICGSDPNVLEGSFGYDVPITLGHEMSGVIEELGKNATRKGLKVGDHVAGNFLHFCGACYYCLNGQQQFCSSVPERKSPGMSEYVIWHESQAYKLPEGVTLRQGCMLEPLSIAVRAADKVRAYAGNRVAISGGGPIGQLVLQVLRLQGATSLTLIEPIKKRREQGKLFGAKNVIDPINQNVEEEAMRITNGFGFDVVCDFSGIPAAVEILPSITAKGGSLLYGAMYPVGYKMPLDLFTYCYHNELTIAGIFLSPYTFPRSVQLLPHIDLEPFVAVSYPLERVAEAFDVHMTGEHLKVLIRCNDLD